jgi:hypothetical protein
MILLNLKRTVMCISVLVSTAFFISSVSHAQTPTSKTEKVAATDSDSDGVPSSNQAKEEPAAVATNVSQQPIDSLSFKHPAKVGTEADVRKVDSETAAESTSLERQSASVDSGWHFGLAPYLFATGISGTVGARGRTLEVDANFGSVWKNLDIGLMGAFEARKGRFVILNDLVWAKLSSERDTPGPFYSTAKLGINLFIFDPELGYRVVDSKKGSLDILGGVRVWSVETNLNVTTGALPGFDVSQRKTWAAPVVGLHGIANVTPRFFLAGKFDIGGAGIGADLTTQVYGAAGYRITKHVALIGGYRWLQVDYDDEKGFLFDTQMSGLMFGAKFSW